MNIIGVKYEALVSLGNYENEKIGLEARISEGESVETTVEALRGQVFALLHRSDTLDKRYQLQRELATLERNVSEARENWSRTQDFLKAQGLRPDAPDFPSMLKQIAPPSESVEVLHADLIGDEE